MEILEVIIIACAGAVLCIMIKEFSPTMGAVCAICTGIVLTYYVTKNIEGAIGVLNGNLFKDLSDRSWLMLIVKCAFITYTAEIGSLICEDLGYKSFSGKIGIISRFGVLAVLMPEFVKIYEYITGLI